MQKAWSFFRNILKFKKISKASPHYFGKKLVKFGSEQETEVDFSPEVSFFFSKFLMFWALQWQKVGENGVWKWKFATGNGNGVQKCLKTMFFWKKNALFGKKLRNFATGNGNGVQKCLKTTFFEKNARFLAKSFGILPQETEMGSRNAQKPCFFEKKRTLFGKKFEIYKIFHPQTGNTRLLLRF